VISLLKPKPMAKVSILVYQDQLNPLIDKLHESGLLQITDIRHEEPEILEKLYPASPTEEYAKCVTYELKLTRILEILEKYSQRETGLKALLHPEPIVPKPVRVKTLKEFYQGADTTLEKLEEKVGDTGQRLKELGENMALTDQRIEMVRDLSLFDFDLGYLGEGEWTTIRAGRTSNVGELERLLENLEAEVFSIERRRGKEKYRVVILALLKEEEKKISSQLKRYFAEYQLGGVRGKPREAIKQLSNEKENLEKQRKEKIAELQHIYREKSGDLLALREEFSIQKERKEILEKFAKSEFAYLIEGWTLEREIDQLEKLTKDTTGELAAFFSTKAKSNPDNPPVCLEQPAWLKPFRPFTDLFAIPRYDEIDPTAFVGFGFALFFGMMLGDAGYGLLILGLSLLGLLKFGKLSPTLKQWSLIGVWLGAFTTLAGVLFGGFFGNMLQNFFPMYFPGEELYSLTLAGFSFPLNPLTRPIDVLSLALVIGLVHLNLSLVLAIYQDYFRKQSKKIIFEELPWFLLQAAGIPLIFKYLLHMEWFIRALSSRVELALIIVLLVGLVLLVLGKGPLGVFDITGFLGDVLSYTRLLALGLATSGIALAINLLAEIFSDLIGVAVVGAIIAGIILVIGHLFNLFIQSLGSAVHSLRLQYVEFFKRFYEGGGREFTPFKVERVYSELKTG